MSQSTRARRRIKWAIAIAISIGLVLAFTGDPQQTIVVRCQDRSGLPKNAVPLEVHCPASLGRPESASELGTTGPDGYLRLTGTDAYSRDCRIRVIGDSKASLGVGDGCKRRRFLMSSCVEIEAHLIVN